MSSIAADTALREQMESNPDAADLIEVRVRRILRGGTADYITAIGQPFMGRWEAEDYLAFARVWYDIHTGELGVFRVHVGEEPYTDRSREDNDAVLRKLWHPFEASVDMRQNNHFRGDGSFSWAEPVLATSAGGGDVELQPWTVPLEVGTSHATTTLLHTREHGGVARWPYHSKDIIVIAQVARTAMVRRDKDKVRIAL